MLEFGLLRITKEDRTIVGTGFLVSKTHVFTCAHVVCAALEIDAATKIPPDRTVRLNFPFFPGNPKHRAQVEVWYPAKDQMVLGELDNIAVLRLESSIDEEGFFPKNAQPLQLITDENNITGRFKACGFPNGSDYGATVEVNLSDDPKTQGWLQVSAFLQSQARVKGFSGAPVWSESLHKAIGMMVASRSEVQDKGSAYMIPANLLHRAFPLNNL